MTKETLEAHVKTINRARAIMRDREDIAAVLQAITTRDNTITIQADNGNSCCVPLRELRDVLTDRLIDFDRRLGEELEAL